MITQCFIGIVDIGVHFGCVVLLEAVQLQIMVLARRWAVQTRRLLILVHVMDMVNVILYLVTSCVQSKVIVHGHGRGSLHGYTHHHWFLVLDR